MRYIVLIMMVSTSIICGNLPKLNLNKYVVFNLIGPVNPAMAYRFHAHVASENKTVVVHIRSNGGNVQSVAKMLDNVILARRRGVKFTCVAERAYSAAFWFFTLCDTRYVTPNTMLMMHRATISFMGDLDNAIRDALAMQQMVHAIERRVAKKLSISYEQYHELIRYGDFYIRGSQAVKNGAADSTVNLTK